MTLPFRNSRTLSCLSALLGAGFPLIGWYTEMLYHRLPISPGSVLVLHQDMVVVWLLDTAPVVMGLYGYLLGSALEKLGLRLKAQIQSEDKLRLLLNNLGSGVIMINPSGTIQACNRTACAMFGYTEHELLGRNVRVLPPEIAAMHDQ